MTTLLLLTTYLSIQSITNKKGTTQRKAACAAFPSSCNPARWGHTTTSYSFPVVVVVVVAAAAVVVVEVVVVAVEEEVVANFS